MPVRPLWLWPGPARPRSLKLGRARTKLETGRAQAGPSSSEVALGLDREVCPRQALEQGHLKQGRLERGLASLEAEGELGEPA